MIVRATRARADLAHRLVHGAADAEAVRRELRHGPARERRQHHADAGAGEKEAGQPEMQVVGLEARHRIEPRAAARVDDAAEDEQWPVPDARRCARRRSPSARLDL